MSQQPEQNPERNSSIDALEGGWLRRERERIAVGRKALATKLGSTESRVHTIEWRRQPVPVEWVPALRSLGFRIPIEVSVATESVGAQRAPQAVDAAPAVVTVPATEPQVESAVESVVESAVESAGAASIPASNAAEVVAAGEDVVVAPALAVESPQGPALVAEIAPAVESAPSVAPAVEVVAVVDVAASGAPPEARVGDVSPQEVPPSTLSQREPPTSNPGQPTQLYHGRWLRERRYEKAVRMQTLIQKLQSSEAELYALERHNIRLPLRWIPRLLKLNLLTLEESKAASRLPRMSQLDGIWLERQRALLKMTPDELGKNLGVSGADVRLVESRAWLVPSEWFPKLTTLLEERRAAKAKAKAAADAAKAEHKTGLKKLAPSSLSIRSDKSAMSGKVESRAVSKAESKVARTESSVGAKGDAKADSKAESKVSSGRSGVSRASGKDLTQALAESVIAHRIKLGLHAGQPAIEVLAQIAQDLRLALGTQTVGYDALADAMRALLRR